MDCLFCKIVAGEIPCNKIFEDHKIIAFYDIDPQAPVHFLVIPKVHIASCDDIDSANCDITAHIFKTIPAIAAGLSLENGYRVVCNCKEDGGQSVPHLHFHILGGRALGWPPFSK